MGRRPVSWGSGRCIEIRQTSNSRQSGIRKRDWHARVLSLRAYSYASGFDAGEAGAKGSASRLSRPSADPPTGAEYQLLAAHLSVAEYDYQAKREPFGEIRRAGRSHTRRRKCHWRLPRESASWHRRLQANSCGLKPIMWRPRAISNAALASWALSRLRLQKQQCSAAKPGECKSRRTALS